MAQISSSIVHSDPHWGVRALEFVDAVERAKTPADVETLFRASIAQAGFGAYVMCGLPDAQTDFRNRVLANGWPSEWSRIYLAENFAKNDPVERHCLRSVDPFDWGDAYYDAEAEPVAKSIMQRAADFGMKQGLCVPIHYGDGSGAAVSIAGERPDLGSGVRAAMYLMALYAYHRVRSLIRRSAPRAGRVLTDREREVLQWTAAGKTSWEISQILGVSESTVTAHIKAAAAKFGAPNRVATVVAALLRGEISL
jgi:LuxR family quorum sensing-dependent transcriptional regulator